MARPRKNASTSMPINSDSDIVVAEAIHAHKVAVLDSKDDELTPAPSNTVSSDELDPLFDEASYQPILQTHYKQKELPFKPEFKAKASLWEFAWVKWKDKDSMDGSQAADYRALVRKGDSYKGHKYTDMFPDEAFMLDGKLIPKGKTWDLNTKSWVSELVLVCRPRAASKAQQKAIVEKTERLFSNGGQNVNPKLRNIIDSSAGDVSMRSDEPGKDILRSTTSSRWVKTTPKTD